MPVYTKICFNGLIISKVPFSLEPNFSCPNCQNNFKPKYMPTAVLPTNYNFNQLVTFTCINCSSEIKLYVALHNDADGLQCCIQRSSEEGVGGIPVNWWMLMKLKGDN
jgi:hypothetical protein